MDIISQLSNFRKNAVKKIKPEIIVPAESAIVEKGLVTLRAIRDRWDATSIENDAEYALAAIDLRQVKSLIEAAELERNAIVKPINAGVKRLNEFFKRLTGPATAYETAAKSAIVGYEETKRAKALKEAEKQAKLVAKKSPEMAADIRGQALVVPVLPETAGIQLRKRWSYRVTDIDAIPREFLVLDESKLQKYADAMKDTAKVNGVEFFIETSVAASAN